MLSRIRSLAVASLASLMLLTNLSSAACLACPFCAAPSLTLSEQVAQSDAVVLVQWVEAFKAEGKTPGSTSYEVVQVVKAPEGTANKASRITLDRFREGKKGDLFVLLGSKATTIEWGTPLEVSEASFQYMAQAPSPEQPTQKRLEYFMKFLEFPDELVANDAFGEFANAPYKDVVPLTNIMPRERLRKWVVSPETSVTRLGLYGMMLGLCGNEDDAKLMEKKILEPTEDFRLGIDGIMGGYLLLTKDKGLDLIDSTKLSKAKKVPFSETYAAMQAVRFMWTYAEGRISKDRLRQSMRSLLDRPELADLVVADLSLWKDWSVQDKLLELYDHDDYNIPSIKRAIIRYYMASAKDMPKDATKPPEHVARAKSILDQLREKDPQLVKEAERFSLLQ